MSGTMTSGWSAKLRAEASAHLKNAAPNGDVLLSVPDEGDLRVACEIDEFVDLDDHFGFLPLLDGGSLEAEGDVL